MKRAVSALGRFIDTHPRKMSVALIGVLSGSLAATLLLAVRALE